MAIPAVSAGSQVYQTEAPAQAAASAEQQRTDSLQFGSFDARHLKHEYAQAHPGEQLPDATWKTTAAEIRKRIAAESQQERERDLKAACANGAELLQEVILHADARARDGSSGHSPADQATLSVASARPRGLSNASRPGAATPRLMAAFVEPDAVPSSSRLETVSADTIQVMVSDAGHTQPERMELDEKKPAVTASAQVVTVELADLPGTVMPSDDPEKNGVNIIARWDVRDFKRYFAGTWNFTGNPEEQRNQIPVFLSQIENLSRSDLDRTQIYPNLYHAIKNELRRRGIDPEAPVPTAPAQPAACSCVIL
jgi:hypothetical protein